MNKRLPSAKHPKMKPGVPKAKRTSPGDTGKPFRAKKTYKPSDEAGSKPPRRSFDRDEKPRATRPFRERGDARPPRADRDSFDRKPFKSREERAPRSSVPRDDRPKFGRKPFGERSDRPARPARNFEDRKPYRSSESGERRERPARPARKFEERKPYHAGEPNTERRPYKPRESSEARFEKRPRFGDGPRDKARSFDSRKKPDWRRKPDGAKDRRSYGDRPARNRHDDRVREPRSQHGFEDRAPARRNESNPGGLFRIYGRRPVLEVLKLGIATRVDMISSAHGRIIEEIKQFINEQQLDFRVIDAESLSDDLAEEFTEQGICAWAPAPEVRTDLKPFARELAQETRGIVLMLDGVLDPHNFGAILRSAAAAEVKAVIVRDRRQAPLSEVAVRASAGLAYFVPVFEVTNLASAMHELETAGFWNIAAAGVSDATMYREFDWNRKTCLILGSEGKGVSQLVRERADAVVSIPLAEAVDSLNVSVAAGILLFEARMQQLAAMAN